MCFCSALNDAAPYAQCTFDVAVVGEAISLPLASNLIEIIFERTAPDASLV